MKQVFFVILFLGAQYCVSAQQITGNWFGAIDVDGIKLRIVIHINQTDKGLNATMDSPDQGAKEIPVSTISFENAILKFSIKMAGAEYEGAMKNDSLIEGIFKQGGRNTALNFSRKEIEKEKINRPQEPKKPYPYYEEEVTFENKKANIQLAGTLTLPQKEGKYAAVILISGSGPQNRDEELLGHKPFLIISDYLTRNGIAVLRYDDRGTAKSKGNFKTATTADLTTDAEAAFEYLLTRKEIDASKIGLMGHSEGGVIAPIVAANNGKVAFIVLLAGTGIRGDKLLLMQSALIAKASGTSDKDVEQSKKINAGAFELVLNINDTAKLRTELTKYLIDNIKNIPEADKPKGIKDEELIQQSLAQLMMPWMLYFLRYDPATNLEKVKCPVLALNGSKDLQVPPNENLSAIKAALEKGGNKKFTITELPNLNHLFQECKSGSPDEYAKIEQTISPNTLEAFTNWIKTVTK